MFQLLYNAMIWYVYKLEITMKKHMNLHFANPL